MVNIQFYPIPYRDTARREAIVAQALQEAYNQYVSSLSQTPAVRPLFFNDLLLAGAPSSVVTEAGIVFSTVTASASTFNLTSQAIITFTTPNNKVYNFYGIADEAANPSLRVWVMTIAGTVYNPIYLLPSLVTNEDKEFILNGTFRPIPPNTTVTISLYGNATTSVTEQIDFLGFVAETPPSLPTA
ncbi:MAG: hypothetical protein QW203_07360 [Thermoplasmatales archaeon]